MPIFLKLCIAYEGTPFIGWQENREQPTVERELRLALERVLQQPVQLEAASRTDAGVHALAQIVRAEFHHLPSRYEELTKLQHSLNALLPDSIVVRSVQQIESFHPTLDASGKCYHYHLCLGPFQLPHFRRTSWHVPDPLDLTSMRQAAELFIGTHNFLPFTNEAARYEVTDPTRTLTRVELIELPQHRLRVEVEGERFLFRMVRNIVGSLVDVGRARLEPDQVCSLLKGGKREEAGVCAPAHGLTLAEVFYTSANCRSNSRESTPATFT